MSLLSNEMLLQLEGDTRVLKAEYLRGKSDECEGIFTGGAAAGQTAACAADVMLTVHITNDGIIMACNQAEACCSCWCSQQSISV